MLILTFLLMGGYYVRNIPVWISWIRYISFLYWGYNLLIKSQFRFVPLCCRGFELWVQTMVDSYRL